MKGPRADVWIASVLAISSALAWGGVAHAQQQTVQGSFPPPGGAPRDQRAAQTGTAVIRGRVFGGDNGRPLRRARITLNAPELGSETRATSTSLDGRYEIKDLPAGRYTIRVARSGYLPLQYGQRRPFEQGKPFQLADRQVVENIDFSLPKSSVITGRVTDEFSEPVADVQVFAMRLTYWQGRRRLVPAGGGPASRTDDAGEYRLTGLMPGTYVVMAMLRETWTVAEGGVEQTMGYATTYYPGTKNPEDAQRIAVGVAAEVRDSNFSLVPGRSASVAGFAYDSLGRPLAGRNVMLAQEVSGPGLGLVMGAGNATTAADGSFAIKNVPPGDYKLRLQATTPGQGQNTQGVVQENATYPITIDGVDIAGILLATESGWSISGHVVAEDGGAPSAPRERFRLAARPVDGASGPGVGPPMAGNNADSGRIFDDWTFTVTGIVGASRLRATVPDGWAVKAILMDGRDVSDAALDAKSGEELASAQVIVTNSVTSVTGQLVDEKGVPQTDGTIVLFADDSLKWAEDSRWVRGVRPDQQGQYTVKGLPPGNYLAIALDYVEDGAWNDPEYLASVRPYAEKLTLADGESKTVTLRLRTP